MQTTNQLYISDVQVAGRYGKHRSWPWRELKRDPKFPRPVKIGGSTRWRLDQIEEWEAAQAKASA